MSRILTESLRTVAGALIIIAMSSGSVIADAVDVQRAKDLVHDFYAAYIEGDVEEVSAMFAHDASGRLVTKYGYGLPDSVIKFKGQKIKAVVKWEVPKKYRKYMNSYRESGHKYRIVDTVIKDEVVVVKARLTSRYSITRHSGKNYENTKFIIDFLDGEPKIAKFFSKASFD